MAELKVPWATLLKIIAAITLVWLWLRLWWLVLMALVAVIVAVGLWPVVTWLQRHRWPRWLASFAVVFALLGLIVLFVVLTWASLSEQAHNLGNRLQSVAQGILERVPPPIAGVIQSSGATSGLSMLAPRVAALGRAVLWAITTFVLASILVLYLLIEAEPTYRWVRGFVPARHRQRFDATAREAREAAFGYVVGNVVTSIFAGTFVYVALLLLGVPAALLLAVLAFVCDFIPVVGFFISCLPAVAMAATKSGALAVAMLPLYLGYHAIENYFIGPRVYGGRLDLSKVAVLLAFAAGAELGGVVGALVALPVAAVYPTIERHWLREPFGADVVRAHEQIRVNENA